MTISATAGLVVAHSLRFRSLRATPFGLCAAGGLLLTMAWARVTARRRGQAPDAVWDAGLLAIISCFIASRLLLVLRDPQAFARFPLLVLSLPSLTLGGMAFAAALLWIYLWRKRLAVLPLLDVYAPPAAVLAACLELGHWLDGSEEGMPSHLPWAVRLPGDGSALRVHPVALYGVVVALAIGIVLWRFLVTDTTAGRTAALGCLLGGAVAFGLDTLTQPVPSLADLWLEPGQWVALSAMVCGAVLWVCAPLEGRASVRSEAPGSKLPDLYPSEQERSLGTPDLHPSEEERSLGTPDLHPSEQERSLGTPDLHPSEQERSLGTPDLGHPNFVQPPAADPMEVR